MGTTKWGRPHPARRIRRVCMSTWYCSLQPQIQCYICALEGKLQDILMLQSFPSLREWGSCKIAPKPVGCGDPVVLSGIPGCSDTFLLVDHETSGTINLVCWEGRLCLPVRCQEVIWKWELVINRCWSGAVLPLPCSCHLCDEVVTVTLLTREGGWNLCSCQWLSWVTGPAGCQCHTKGCGSRRNWNSKSCLPETKRLLRLCCRKWRWQTPCIP